MIDAAVMIRFSIAFPRCLLLRFLAMDISATAYALGNFFHEIAPLDEMPGVRRHYTPFSSRGELRDSGADDITIAAPVSEKMRRRA